METYNRQKRNTAKSTIPCSAAGPNAKKTLDDAEERCKTSLVKPKIRDELEESGSMDRR